jgi:hypothetical protein
MIDVSLQDQMSLGLEGQIAIEVGAEDQENFFLALDKPPNGLSALGRAVWKYMLCTARRCSRSTTSAGMRTAST